MEDYAQLRREGSGEKIIFLDVDSILLNIDFVDGFYYPFQKLG